MAPLVQPEHLNPSMKTSMTTPLPNLKHKNSTTIFRLRPSLSHFPLVMSLLRTKLRTPTRMIQKPLSRQSPRLKVSLRLNLEPKSTPSQRLRVRLKRTQMLRSTLTPRLRLTLTLRSTPTLRLTLMLRLMPMLALSSRLTPMLSVDAIPVLEPRQG